MTVPLIILSLVAVAEAIAFHLRYAAAARGGGDVARGGEQGMNTIILSSAAGGTQPAAPRPSVADDAVRAVAMIDEAECDFVRRERNKAQVAALLCERVEAHASAKEQG